MGKAMVCRCEDITLEDCQHAIAEGYSAFEDLKRFLGLATGPCQGKACVQATMKLLSETRGIPLDDVDIMTFRPPVRPVPFATLAALPDDVVEGSAEPAPDHTGAQSEDKA